MKKLHLSPTFFVLLAILLVVCAIVIGVSHWLHYTGVWGNAADFEPYEAEFVLVCDYVKTYMDGKSGTLSVSFQEPHKYDLYDNHTKAYLECPENIRTALRVIAQQAFSHKDAHFETIRCEGDQVAFELISNPYRLVYSPEKEPSAQTIYQPSTVLHKKIKDGWYHVTIKTD